MVEMNIIGRAVVQVFPVFTGNQKEIARQIGPAAKQAGKSVGRDMGAAISDGVSEETKKLRVEADKFGKEFEKAQERVTAAKQRTLEATRKEAEATGKLRLAAAQLADVRAKSNASTAQTIAAEERLAQAFTRSQRANEERATAEKKQTAATAQMKSASDSAAESTAKLTDHLRKSSVEMESTERRAGRLSRAFGKAFERNGDPLKNMAANITRDSKSITNRLRATADNIGNSGTRGGRAFNRGFALVGAGLALLPPLAGGVSSALLGTVGAVVTLADSMKDLAGVSALLPAALVTVAGAGGVLRAAFAGVGEALKTATDTATKIAGNAALDAMALEDAATRISEAEKNAADVSADSKRRIADAEQDLTDARDQAADDARDAYRRVEDAEQNLVDVAEQAAEDQAAALRKVEDAREGVAEAARQATASIADANRKLAAAEGDVARANRDARDAQQSLNDARKEAVDRIEELNDALTGAGLSERGAVINLEEAQNAFQEGVADGADMGSLRMRKLVLDVDEAKFALEEARERSAELATQQAEAAAAGVEGDRAVVSARRGLADAENDILAAKAARQIASDELVEAEVEGDRKIAAARRDLDDAIAESVRTERDGVRSVADAERELEDARADARETEMDGVRDIADARRNLDDINADAVEAQLDAAADVADAYRDLTREQLRQADAASDAGQKAADAMAKLSTNAQLAVGSILGVYARLQDIKDVIQDNFFAGFTEPFERMADVLLPQVESGAGRVATALGVASQQLMTSLTEALGSGVLEQLLDSVANVITNLTPAIDPLVKAFVTLATVGMPYMEELATWISESSIRFNDLVQQAAGDGSLNTWIEAGIQGFQDLTSIVGSLLGIIGALADAARAGGIDVTLGSLADALIRVRDVMEGPVFQKTMGTIFQGAAEGSEGLADGLRKIGDAFVIGAPAFADFLRLGGEIVGLITGGLAQALSNPDFGTGLTDFMTGLRNGAEKVMEKLPELTTQLGELLTDLAPIFEKLGPTLIEVFTALADGIEDVVEFLSPMLTAMADSPAAIGLLLTAIVGTGLLAALATFAANIVAVVTVGGTLITLLQKIVPALKILFNFLKLGSPFGWIVLGITAVITALHWFFTETELGRELWAGFVSGLKDAWNGLKDWFMNDFLPALLALFSGSPDMMIQVGKDLLAGLWAGIQAADKWLTDLVDGWVQGLIQWVKDLFGIKSPSKVFAEIGSWLVEGLGNGITAAGQFVLDALNGIWKFFTDTWENIKRITGEAAEWVRSRITTKLNETKAVWSLIWTAIKQKLSDIWESAKRITAAAIEWIRSWVATKLEAIRRGWEAAWSAIRQRLSDIWEGAKRIVSAGIEWIRKWIADKLENMKRNWSNAWESVRKTVSDIWDRITSKVSDAWTKLKRTLDTLISFVKKNIGDAFETAKDGVKKQWDKIQNIAAKPIRFVVERVVNEGLLAALNTILPKSLEIKPLKLPKDFGGYRKGGFTGKGHDWDAAGVVHRNEFVFDAAATAAAGPERLAAMADGLKHKGLPGLAASIGQGNMGGFFEGNAANIRRHGAYYLDVPAAMAPWNFRGAANMWDGAAGVKVKIGRGAYQGRATQLERGGGILGYTTGGNIDMSPTWMRQLSATQRRTVAAHEMGHAMGLPHNSLRSIMQPNLANMATGPTAVDIRNLQTLFAGGSGKAGDGGGDEEAQNPLNGLLKGLLEKITKQFPEKNIFIDTAVALVTSGFDKAFSFLEDIRKGISKIAGDVVDSVKNFFGFGGDDGDNALFRDQGGYLPPGLNMVRNNTGGDEYILNQRQWGTMSSLARSAARNDGPSKVYNVELPQRATVDDLIDAVNFEDRRAARGGQKV